MGFEPTTFSLARRCSTTEPLPLTGATVRPRRHSPRCRASGSQYTLTSTAVHSCWRCQHSTIHTWKAVDGCHVGRRGRAGQLALFIIGTRPSYIDQRQPLWLPIQGSWPPLPQEQVELLDGREVLEAGERFVERLFQYLEAIVPDQCARRFHEANVVEYHLP